METLTPAYATGLQIYIAIPLFSIFELETELSVEKHVRGIKTAT